jgi:hypothetical protein
MTTLEDNAKTLELHSNAGVQGFACEADVSGWRPKTPTGLSEDGLPSTDNRGIDYDVSVSEWRLKMPSVQTEEDLSSNVIENIVMNICTDDDLSSKVKVPKFVFIIPYRNRAFYLQSFMRKMSTVLEDIPKTDYEIYVIHQNDTRKFNRGAIKNIGFLYIKNKYPKYYKQMTLVFNDVDIFPLRKNYLDYITTKGVVKHFFGFNYALGGIVSIVGEDFERINGFPNFWAWGYEDNLIQTRIVNAGITIDRSNFYDLIVNVNDGTLFACINSGTKRLTSKTEYVRYMRHTTEGYNHIYDIQLTETPNQIPPHIVIPNTIESELPLKLKNTNSGSIHSATNNMLVHLNNTDYTPTLDFITVNVNHFLTEITEQTVLPEVYDLRNGAVPYKGIINTKRRPQMYMGF